MFYHTMFSSGALVPCSLTSTCVHNHLPFLKHMIVVMCPLSTTTNFGVISLLVTYNYQHVGSSPPTSGFHFPWFTWLPNHALFFFCSPYGIDYVDYITLHHGIFFASII